MKHYEKGRRLEQELARHLRAVGFEVTRAAGSKSKFDLVAYNALWCLHIQVKSKKPNDLWVYLTQLQFVCAEECTAIIAVKNQGKKGFTCWQLLEGVVTPTTI